MDKSVDNSNYFSNLKKIADFFSKFEKPYDDPEGGYKQLTHPYEEQSSVSDYIYPVNRVRMDLLKYERFMQKDLYETLFGFLYGPSWKDLENELHDLHCSSKELHEWCAEHPGQHPRNEKCFFNDLIGKFKNTIRVYDGNLPEYIGSKDFQRLNIHDKTESFDAYCYVPQLVGVIKKILSIINSSDKLKKYGNEVEINYCDDVDIDDNYFLSIISIEHVGSRSSNKFDKVRKRLTDGGGDLSTLKGKMQGYFLWSIEATWCDESYRWNILKDENSPEYEKLESTSGFKHVIKVLNRK